MKLRSKTFISLSRYIFFIVLSNKGNRRDMPCSVVKNYFAYQDIVRAKLLLYNETSRLITIKRELSNMLHILSYEAYVEIFRYYSSITAQIASDQN